MVAAQVCGHRERQRDMAATSTRTSLTPMSSDQSVQIQHVAHNLMQERAGQIRKQWLQSQGRIDYDGLHVRESIVAAPAPTSVSDVMDVHNRNSLKRKILPAGEDNVDELHLMDRACELRKKHSCNGMRACFCKRPRGPVTALMKKKCARVSAHLKTCASVTTHMKTCMVVSPRAFETHIATLRQPFCDFSHHPPANLPQTSRTSPALPTHPANLPQTSCNAAPQFVQVDDKKGKERKQHITKATHKR